VSARELPAKEQTAAHIAGLFAILGKPYDEFRPVWSGADMPARRVFLKIAKLPEVWAARSWDGLGREERELLKTRVFALRDFLAVHLPARVC
jgi:hypothetical protein